MASSSSEASIVPESQAAQDQEADLCLACGACCRGVIFSDVVLQPNEVEQARELQLRLSYRKKEAWDVFMQPCACHIEGQCSIYPDRFKSCRSYRCELLKRYSSGAIPLSEALAIVQKVQSLEEKLEQLLGNRDRSKSIWESLEDFFVANQLKDSPDSWKQYPEVFLTSRTLSLVCHKYFEPRMDAQLNATVQPVRANS